MTNNTLPGSDNNSLEYAGFWLRAGATLIDSFIQAFFVLLFLWLYIGDATLAINVAATGENTNLVGDILQIIFFGVAVILFWVYWQATPGKMVISAKIVDAQSGGKPSVGQYVRRYFTYIPSLLLFGLGVFWIAFDKRKQGWHDKLASTVVVRKKAAPISFPESGAAQQGPEYAARRDAQFQAPQELAE